MSGIQIKAPAFLDQAACAGKDPELWHPTDGGWTNVRQAVAICRTCPVRVACFEWALQHTQQFGVWGGTTAEQRLEVLRRRKLSTEPVDNSSTRTAESLPTPRSEQRIEA